MEFVVITGISGAGKTLAINTLEDLGYYCVDNMPPQLLSVFVDLCEKSGGEITKVALVADVRGGNFTSALFKGLDDLKERGYSYKILYLDSNDDIIARRYRETRRKHPLSDIDGNSLEQCIACERELLLPIRERADIIIDTTSLSSAQHKNLIASLVLQDYKKGLVVHCMSFGFKYGNPAEADLIFDVRCFPNPFYIDELKDLRGTDKAVSDFVLKSPDTQGFVDKLIDFIDYMLPLYQKEGKSRLVIAIGCTGGKHRSVALTELLYNHLEENGVRVTKDHRDIKRL